MCKCTMLCFKVAHLAYLSINRLNQNDELPSNAEWYILCFIILKIGIIRNRF